MEEDEITTIAKGLLEAPFDSRDANAAAFEGALGATEVPDFELPQIGPVRYQGNKPFCVGESIAEIVDHANALEGIPTIMSGRDVYAWCKALDGAPELEGTFFKTALEVAINKGVLETKIYPDDISVSYAEFIKPYLDRTKAEPFKIKGYVRFNNIEEAVRYVFANKLPALVGVNGNNWAWNGTAIANNGNIVPMWNPSLGSNWGHGFCLVGKKTINGKEYGIVENWWGHSWGINGRAYLPFDYNGLQTSSYGVFDLPNNWKEINDNYKETTMTEPQINAIDVALYRVFLGRDPKPEELAILRQRNQDIIRALNHGGPDGQKQLENIFKGFLGENIAAAKAGILKP